MLVFADRVKESALVSGVGAYALSGAAPGYQGFVAALGNGARCTYCAEGGVQFEVAEGTVNSGTISRDKILSSSNGGAAVVWPAGTVAIFCVAPASVIQRSANSGVSVTTPGTLQVLAGTSRWYPPQAISFGGFEAWVGTAPSGAAVQFTLRQNGISVATGTIAAGSQRMAFTPIALSLTPSDWFTLDITQIGSSVAGSDLTVRLLP